MTRRNTEVNTSKSKVKEQERYWHARREKQLTKKKKSTSQLELPSTKGQTKCFQVWKNGTQNNSEQP